MTPRSPDLAHVTLTTGHVRRSPRDEVGAPALEVLRPLLARVLAGETVEVPWVDGTYRLRGVADAGCCALVLLGDDAAIVATIGIGGDPAGSPALWRQLHQYALDAAPVVTDPAAPPPVPWCAARLDVGATTHPDAMEWLGDLERCLAWAYLTTT